MNVGILGSSALATAVVRRLVETHRVHVFPEDRSRELGDARIVAAPGLAQLARSAEVLFVCAASTAEMRDLLLGPAGLCEGLSPGKIVIDQTPGDPAQARAMAAELQQRGVVFIDAPIHCEQLDALPDTSAIMCGGPADAVESVRQLLESICPKVVHVGEAGSGRAARLVVAAVAASNRLVTYECAAMGFRNGLSVEDMATVLTRCSGYSSGTARVLPAIAAGGRTADVSLRSVVEDLTTASQLAMHVGAPMLIGNLVRSLLQAESNGLGAAAGLDDTFRLFRDAVGMPAAGTDEAGVGAAPQPAR